MKLVRCNNCEHEYVFYVDTGHTYINDICPQCRATDYTILEDDVKVVAKNDIEDECDLEIQNADIKHSLALFKEELLELIETYISPFLK